ncbi:MAG: DUF3387 domain-containing protein [Chromatiaceae bacterium]|nr:MAG: DUF3387 domain-containing protein [Chromatiaceae bacterium]
MGTFRALGYDLRHGPELGPDAPGAERSTPQDVILAGRVRDTLRRLNAELPHNNCEEVVRVLSRPPHPTLVQNNRWFHTLLTDGVEVEYRDAKSGETRGGRARLIDFDQPTENDLVAVSQLSIAGASGKIIRPDLTVFLNGLPVAVIELKDPTETQADLGVAIDHVLGQDDGWRRFRTLVKELSTAFALVVPRPETETRTPHLAFFQRCAAMIRKRLADESDGGAGQARQRDIDAAVRQVIGGAVSADEVIDLFAVAGLEEARLDILSDEFLGRVAALEQKNLALETLRKLLNDQIRITERTNLVQSKRFREALEDAMLRYTNKAISTAEMIARLIDLAKHLREAQKHGEELGLSREETAFYDALADNESAREALQSDTLRLMARELTEMVRKMPKLDWTQRESVRATLRRNVRRLLARYGYPPDLAEGATALVLRQAELSTSNGA